MAQCPIAVYKPVAHRTSAIRAEHSVSLLQDLPEFVPLMRSTLSGIVVMMQMHFDFPVSKTTEPGKDVQAFGIVLLSGVEQRLLGGGARPHHGNRRTPPRSGESTRGRGPAFPLSVSCTRRAHDDRRRRRADASFPLPFAVCGAPTARIPAAICQSSRSQSQGTRENGRRIAVKMTAAGNGGIPGLVWSGLEARPTESAFPRPSLPSAPPR